MIGPFASPMRLLSLLLLVSLSLPARSAGQAAAVLQWRVGAAEAADDDLTFVLLAAVLSNETLVVPQPLTNEVTLVSSIGAITRRIGRRGQGPGEFMALARVGATADGFFVTDAQNMRISQYDRSGNHIHSTQIDIPAAQVLAVLGDTMIAMEPGLADTTTVTLYAGGRKRSLTRYSSATAMLRYAYDDIRGSIRQPISAAPLVAACADASCLVRVDRDVAPSTRADGAYRVILFGTTGVLRQKNFTFRPKPVDPNFADEVIERLTQEIKSIRRRPTNVPALAAALWKGLWVPPTQPPVTSLLVAQTGEIIVGRERVQGRTAYVVLDQQLNIVGQFTLDSRARPLAARAGKIWVASTTEHDEPVIELYRYESR